MSLKLTVSIRSACNFKVPSFTLTELFKAVSYNYGHDIIPTNQCCTGSIRKSGRRGRKKGQPQEEDVILDPAKVLEDERENFLLALHHALIAPLLNEIDENAILGDFMETIDEDHLIAELIEQVEELEEVPTSAGNKVTEQHPFYADFTSDHNNIDHLTSSNDNVNHLDRSLNDILPRIPLTSLEFNSITWIEVIRLVRDYITFKYIILRSNNNILVFNEASRII